MIDGLGPDEQGGEGDEEDGEGPGCYALQWSAGWVGYEGRRRKRDAVKGGERGKGEKGPRNRDQGEREVRV